MGKSRKDYEKYLNSISPDRDDEAWMNYLRNLQEMSVTAVDDLMGLKERSREEVDSCWGCYEETDELIKEVMIENGLEE